MFLGGGVPTPIVTHDLVVIMNSYVDYATEKVGYKI